MSFIDITLSDIGRWLFPQVRYLVVRHGRYFGPPGSGMRSLRKNAWLYTARGIRFNPHIDKPIVAGQAHGGLIQVLDADTGRVAEWFNLSKGERDEPIVRRFRWFRGIQARLGINLGEKE